MAESGFKHKITFQNQQNASRVKITPKIEKERLYGLTHHLALLFQQTSVKNSSAYWINISQKRINRNNVKISYSSLPNFKSVIKEHNKNILNEQEKPSPCNCRDKTSCPLNRSC